MVDGRSESMNRTAAAFLARYPHGVLTEQEGGIPNDALDWEAAIHVCRKHRIREGVCIDAMAKP
jgi:hypothetical protein